MRKITVKLFKFDELSDEAKQKAISDYLNEGHEPAWSSENRQTLEAFEKVFPINISNWSYGDRSEGVTFSIVSENIEKLSGIRLATYLWNNYKWDLYKGKYYSKYVGEKIYQRFSKIILNNSCILTGYYMDDVILKPIYEFLDKPESNITFEDLLNDCFNCWIKGCNDDVESQQSEDYLADHFEANDYEFEEDGTYHY